MRRPKRWRVYMGRKGAVIENMVVSVVVWAGDQAQATERAHRKLELMLAWGVKFPLPLDQLEPYKWEMT